MDKVNPKYDSYLWDELWINIQIGATIQFTMFLLSVLFNIINKGSIIIYSTIIYLSLSTFFESYREFIKIHNKHIHTGYSITYNNKIITSTKDFYYLGKTKSYVFFYNEKTELVRVYPVASIGTMDVSK